MATYEPASHGIVISLVSSLGMRRSLSSRVATQQLPATIPGPMLAPAAGGEHPGADHAAGVEVVALVPTVVRDLVPWIGVDERVQHAADFDWVLRWRHRRPPRWMFSCR